MSFLVPRGLTGGENALEPVNVGTESPSPIAMGEGLG